MRLTHDGEYEWPAERAGIIGVHSAGCGIRDGEPCTCGPLGYCAATRDPETGERMVSPLLHSEAAAASWQRTRTYEVHMPRSNPRRARGGDATVGEIADEFLAAAIDGGARDPSGRRYSEAALDQIRIALRGHISEELGDLPIASLRRWQVQGFVNELAESGLSPRRLRAIVASLRGLAQHAREMGLLDESPIDGIITPSEGERPPRPFTTTDQLEAVSTAAQSSLVPDAALWQLMKVVTVVFILIAIVLAAESI
jgi:hypothetical protein